MDEELRSHIEACAEDLAREGIAPEEAIRRAKMEFGGMERVKEECRESRGVTFVENLLQDLRFGLRVLRKSPSFTAIAVLTLALGIGANTAIFSIIDSLLLRPLNVENPGQLAVLAFRQGNGPLLTPFSVADYRDIRSQTTAAFSDMLGFQLGFDGLGLKGKAERVLTNYVTGNYFSMLGLKPFLGRLILPTEGRTQGADPVVVLSYSFWKTRFGGDAAIIGKKVFINGKPSSVVGVVPPLFYGLFPAPAVQAYIPLAMVGYYEPGWSADFMVNRIIQNLYVLGRLRPGVGIRNASAALDVVARRLSAQYPDTDKGMVLSAVSERYARPDPGTAPILITSAALFLALVALVLLLACANIANLLLVRASIRGREMAVRAALGAARSRLVRQMLTESVVLALIGGCAGLLLGLWGSRAIASIDLHTPVPINIIFGFDWRVFAYTFGAMLLAGILFGLVPALRASRTQIAGALHESSRSIVAGKNRLRTGLVVLQVAGSLMLLVVAALFTRSLAAVQHSNLGFDPQNVVNLAMDPTEVGFNEKQGLALYHDLLGRIRALPSVQSAALSGSTPLGDVTDNDYLKISDYQVPPGQALPLVGYDVVSAGYFGMMRIPTVRGHSFTEADTRNSPYVAVVNEAFAHRYWPNQSPIGKHFAKVSGATNPVYEVIGVAGNCRMETLSGAIEPYFYLPLAQDYDLASLQYLQIRSAAPPDAVIRTAQGIVRELAPELPVFNARTMAESLDSLSGFLLFRLGAGFAAALGFLGLALAVVGIYGVISCSVSQRTHEIGIRIALGAQRSEILTLILGQGLLIIAFGVLVGCAAAFAAARLVANLLVSVSPSDPSTYLGVSLLLAFVALVACYIPARRAMKVDPVEALRYE